MLAAESSLSKGAEFQSNSTMYVGVKRSTAFDASIPAKVIKTQGNS